MAPQKPSSISSQVFSAVATLYDISPSQAESIVAYHGSFRLYLGSMLNASQGVGYFETRESNASKGLSLLGKITSFFSFGTSEIVTQGFREFEQFRNEDELEEVAKIATVASEEGIHKFVKALATKITEGSIDALKDLTPEEARKRARDDIAKLKEKIADGIFQDFVIASDVASITSADDSIQATSNLQQAMMQEVGNERGIDFVEEKKLRLARKMVLTSAQNQDHTYSETHPIKGPHSAHIVEEHEGGAASSLTKLPPMPHGDHQDFGGFTHNIVAKEQQQSGKRINHDHN